MEKALVLSQLGCGYWGPNLLRNFSAQKNCHVKWVADPSEDRRNYVLENFPKSKVTADWKRAVYDKEVDAIIIATLASTHYDLARAALEAGKHIFVEKPLAMRTTEADELIRIAHEKELTLMVGHTFLYNPALHYMKDLVDSGDLGQIYYIYCQRLNLGKVRSDINVWWNLAPHDISILLYLMHGEMPTSITTQGMDYIQKGIEDVVFAVLKWDDRTAAHIQVSWLDPSKVRKITLVGSRKMVVYDDINDDKIAIFNKGIDKIPHQKKNKMDYDDFNNYQLLHRAGDIWLPRIDFKEPLKLEASHFLECIREGKTPRTGPTHARDVVRILEAGNEALKTKTTVRIRPALSTAKTAKVRRTQAYS